MLGNIVSESNVAQATSQIQMALWDNLTIPLSENQRKDLLKWQDSEQAILCLLNSWFSVEPKLLEDPGNYCNATWDGNYCWPPTMKGTVVERSCTEVFEKQWPFYAPHLAGTAFRVCQPNEFGSPQWLRGNWTNYTECADSYDNFVEKLAAAPTIPVEDLQIMAHVQHILFIGSIISIAFLITGITIFCLFKSLWCDRVTIHIQLMVALSMRYLLLIIISEPFVLGRTIHYRNEDWICKSVLLLYLYATIASVNWMLIQGVYLNSKLTTNVFDKEAPLKFYYTFGWALPVIIIFVYGIIMQLNHNAYCWKGYGGLKEVWIILVPILFALVVNLGMLANILRILITKGRTPGTSSDAAKIFQRAAKATVILSPVLGINNLLFVYNPGGIYNKYYILLNTVFCSVQGVFVAVIYCYINTDVHLALRRCYQRFNTRRQVNKGILRRMDSQASRTDIIVGHVHGNNCIRKSRYYSSRSVTSLTMECSKALISQQSSDGMSTHGKNAKNGINIMPPVLSKGSEATNHETVNLNA